MDTQRLHESNLKSQSGAMSFSEFVSMLEEMQIDYCKVDLLEGRITFAVTIGDFFTDHLELKDTSVTNHFDDGAIRKAIMDSHQKSLPFKEFLSRLMKAGVVSYTVHPAGKKTIYFGKNGDCCYDNFKLVLNGARPRALGTSTVQW